MKKIDSNRPSLDSRHQAQIVPVNYMWIYFYQIPDKFYYYLFLLEINYYDIYH